MAEVNIQMERVTRLKAKLQAVRVCPNCRTLNPSCLVNRPCRHVTNCVLCQHQTNRCSICKHAIEIFQTEFDLDRQETLKQGDITLMS